MTRLIGTITGEGFVCEVKEDANGKVIFIADADIDADGANGQSGARPAYTILNDGSELLGNGGMGVKSGKVVGIFDWFKDIVITDEDGQPRVFPGGVIASKTAYRYPGKDKDDPTAYVDSETIPYIVVPPMIIQRTKGVVMGCKAVATNLKTGERVVGVVADAGPRTKVGEVSIEMARRLGINPDPRRGGENSPVIQYELWPGVPGEVNETKQFVLQRSNGTHVI